MLSEQREGVLYKLGATFFQEGLPLGFIQSRYFNFEFPIERVSKVKEALIREAKKKYDIDGEIPSEFNKDLLITTFLLENTACYLTVSPKQPLGQEEPSKSGKIEQCLATLNEEITEGILGEGFTDNLRKRFLKAKEKYCTHMGSGLLFVPTIDYNRVPKMKIGRLPVNFIESEYQVIPVSVLNGYVDALRSSIKQNLLKITCRKTGGDMREFLIYADYHKILELYRDEDLATMFESVGSKNSRVKVSGLNFELLSGLHNANLLFFELGISKDDFPKRYMNLLRLRSYELIEDKNKIEEEIISQTRYMDISFDEFLNEVKTIVGSWDNDRKADFLNNVLREYKKRSNTKSHEDLDISGVLDFNMKFDKAVDFYSTTFIRTVVDYVVERPTEFNGYTGKKFSVDDLTSSAVISTTPTVSLAELDDFDIEW